MLSAYTKLINIIEKILEVIVIFLLFAAFVVVFLQVVTRYGFGGSSPWMEESGRYIIIWMSFFGSTIALRHRKHLHVDVLEALLPQKVQYFLNLILDVLLLVFLCILFHSAVMHTISNYSSMSTSIPISMSWVYLSCVVGSGLMFLFELELFFLRIATRKSHPELDHDSEVNS